MKRPGPTLVLLAAAVLLQACGRAARRGEAGTAAEGVASHPADPDGAAQEGAAQPAPAPVAFADLDRVRADLAALKGRMVFVNFWATWCVPCVDELPDLAAVAREAEGEGTAFLGISLDAWVTGEGAETESKVRKALAAAGVTYPNLVYTGDQDPLLEGFRLAGSIPYSILYDSEGRDVARFDEQAEIEEVRRAIASATRKAAGSPRPPDEAASR